MLREINPDLTNTFKDSYVFEFLSLPEAHNERDLQHELVRQMKIQVSEYCCAKTKTAKLLNMRLVEVFLQQWFRSIKHNYPTRSFCNRNYTNYLTIKTMKNKPLLLTLH